MVRLRGTVPTHGVFTRLRFGLGTGIGGSVALCVRDNLLIYGDVSGALYGAPYNSTARFTGWQTHRSVLARRCTIRREDYDIEARSWTRNTFGPVNETAYSRPEWAPDGALVLRTPSGTECTIVTRQAANASGTPDVLHRDAKTSIWEGVVSPDGQYLLYRLGTGAGSDLRYWRMVGDTASRPFVASSRYRGVRWLRTSHKSGHASYDVMPDGRLVFMRSMENAQRLVVAHGWLNALRAKWARAAQCG